MLLLDEPLSALDAKIRVSLREEIRAIQRELGITTIFVTHDQEEALSMSDRIVVMNDGRAEQVGTPFEIYNRPTTRFVASFVGTLNVLDGTIENIAKGVVKTGGATFAGLKLPATATKGGKVTLALRPEALAAGAAPRRPDAGGAHRRRGLHGFGDPHPHTSWAKTICRLMRSTIPRGRPQQWARW